MACEPAREAVRPREGPGRYAADAIVSESAPFLLILLAVGFYAITLFPGITTDAYSTVAADYRSVRAAQQMELALTRMEEGVLLAMEGNKDLGAAVFEQNRISLRGNLHLQLPTARRRRKRN